MSSAIPMVIAEAGVNHNGRLEIAIELVRAAKAAGADIVKFQHFTADKIVAADTRTAAYQRTNTDQLRQADLLRELELDLAAFGSIAQVCREEGIGFLCTAFNVDVIEDLVALGMRHVKIPSGELTNVPMLKRCGALGLPALLSTGMGTMSEVEDAVRVLESAGARDLTILQCTSIYPAPAAALNLRAMVSMAEHFRRPVGFSDHSLDDYAAIAAVALGASVIEKHITLSRAMPGPDHAASLESAEFARMVVRLRDSALALGDGLKRPDDAEIETARLVRRSWHAARNLAPGTLLTSQDIVLKRPADGLAPASDPTGRRIHRAVTADSPITADLLES